MEQQFQHKFILQLHILIEFDVGTDRPTTWWRSFGFFILLYLYIRTRRMCFVFQYIERMRRMSKQWRQIHEATIIPVDRVCLGRFCCCCWSGGSGGRHTAPARWRVNRGWNAVRPLAAASVVVAVLLMSSIPSNQLDWREIVETRRLLAKPIAGQLYSRF